MPAVRTPQNVYSLSQATAQQCASAVDAALGYPSTGVDVGAGPWITPTPVTQTYYPPTQLANGAWVYLADAVTAPILAPFAVAFALPAPVPITSAAPVVTVGGAMLAMGRRVLIWLQGAV